MPMTESFDVVFDANPFHFKGKGQVIVEQDFVRVRGKSRRSLYLRARAEHQLRMVDIITVHTDGDYVGFHVLGVRENLVIGVDTADAAAAERLAALLPQRRTEDFAVAHAEREAFHDRIDYWSPSTPVIWGLLTLNIGIYFLMWLVRRGVSARTLGSMMGWGWNSKIDADVRSYQLKEWGANVGDLTLHGEWWRMVTSLFLHGSLLHLLFNMIALWQVGQLVERLFGSVRFTALYLIAGVCGSIASVMWNPHVNSVGASGAIFGIVGGLLAFTRRENSGVPPTVVNDLRGSLFPFLVFNLAAGFLYPHTDNAAHLGGLAGGWLAGLLLARSLHVPAERSMHERRLHRHL
jgi:rhomboid protease GluP